VVRRSILYRVKSNFKKHSGQSGVALYTVEETVNAQRSHSVVGFQSFKQDSQFPTVWSETEHELKKKLEKGSVAFYGALSIPDDLRDNFKIL
jgi:hypothetical protein